MEGVEVEIPSSMTGKVIGAAGATKKSLEAKFGVKIQIPPRQDGPFGSPSTKIGVFANGPGADVTGAAREIEKICGMLSSSAKVVCVLLFRRDASTGSYQLLLQYRHDTWTIPNDVMTEEGGAVEEFALGILNNQCGADLPYEQLLPVSPPMDIRGYESPGRILTRSHHCSSKSLVHLCLPAEWAPWEPAPSVRIQRFATLPHSSHRSPMASRRRGSFVSLAKRIHHEISMHGLMSMPSRSVCAVAGLGPHGW
jgi:hypothetical protein